jgi:hypothetical protein
MATDTTSPPSLNHYAVRARRHWQEFLPNRYATIEDPERFFAALGEEVATAVEEWMRAHPDSTPETAATESYRDRVARMNMLRSMAEEAVMTELVLLPPEPGTDTATRDESGAYVGADPGMTPTWTPLLPMEDSQD